MSQTHNSQATLREYTAGQGNERVPDDTDKFLKETKEYARSVVENYQLNVDVARLRWEVSKRAKRRAAAVKRKGTEPVEVSITWDYCRERNWSALKSTIRHELIHVHLLNEEDDPTHGEKFRGLASELDTSVNCKIFSEPKWWITCGECEMKLPRYKRSKLVRSPEKYSCGECGDDLTVRKVSNTTNTHGKY